MSAHERADGRAGHAGQRSASLIDKRAQLGHQHVMGAAVLPQQPSLDELGPRHTARTEGLLADHRLVLPIAPLSALDASSAGSPGAGEASETPPPRRTSRGATPSRLQACPRSGPAEEVVHGHRSIVPQLVTAAGLDTRLLAPARNPGPLQSSRGCATSGRPTETKRPPRVAGKRQTIVRA